MIRRLHIGSYGILADRTIELGPGLNLLHGPNEAGKSTLVRFVRHVLFGKAPRRKREPREVALRGGRLGGAVELDLGEHRLRVARYDNELEVIRDGLPVGQDVLEDALGRFDGSGFDAVFSCQAQDLLKLEALEDDALRDTLFAASVAGSEVDVAGIRARFKGLLRERGLNSRRADTPLARSTQQLSEARSALEEARATAQTLPTVVTRERQVRARVSEARSALGDLETRRGAIRALAAQLDERDALARDRSHAAGPLHQLDEAREAIAARWADPTPQARDRVLGWVQQQGAVGDHSEALERARLDITRVEARLEASRPAPPLDPAALREVPWPRVRALSEEVLRARSELAGLPEASTPSRGTPWALVVALVLVAFGALTCLALDLPWVAAALAALAMGLASSIGVVSYRSAATARDESAIARQLALTRADDARARLAEALAGGPAGLPDDPEALIGLEQQVGPLSQSLDELDRLRRVASETEQAISGWVSAGRDVAGVLGRVPPADLAAARALAAEVPAWSADVAELERIGLRRQSAAEELDRLDRRLQALDRAVAEGFTALVGTAPEVADAPRVLSTEQHEVQRQAVALDTELADAQRELGAVQQRRRELEEATSVADAAQDLATAEAARASILAELAEIYVAQTLFEQTWAEFAARRQPGVLERASGWLRVATDEAWRGLRADDGELYAESRDGAVHAPRDLSRGTRDLVYLTVRFALAAEHGQRVPLPLVLDDVLVHQDPARAAGLTRVLGEIAAVQQIMFLTCREATAQQLAAAIPDAVGIALDPVVSG